MYLLTYIINEKGAKFYNKILNHLEPKEYKHAKQFEDVILNENFLETYLFNEEVVIEFYDNIIQLKTMIKYSQFLNDIDSRKRVVNFEGQLVDILEAKDYFIRVDEILIETDYSVENGEGWFNEDNGFGKFSKWIETQEKLHWKKIALMNKNQRGCLTLL